MLTLGIETSCDESAVAFVKDGKLLGEKLATQIDVHALFGGVVPEIASREHLRVLPRLFRQLCHETGINASEIDNVAVARGPGLLGSLLMGVSFGKALALSTGAQLIGVNHLWAHLLAPGLVTELTFPALGLLVSGGHTHTYRIDSPVTFELLGRTLDDAAGEAFDKVAKALNFPYPGGRFIDTLGSESRPDKSLFPRAFIDNPSLDFSFSGLKTAVSNYINKNPDLVFKHMADISTIESLDGERRRELARVCASFNWSVADTLRIKVERAIKAAGDVKNLIVAGGVAANSMIRETMQQVASAHRIQLTLPELDLCTDNGAMIAYAGHLLAERGCFHSLRLEAIPRGRTVPLDWSVGKSN